MPVHGVVLVDQKRLPVPIAGLRHVVGQSGCNHTRDSGHSVPPKRKRDINIKYTVPEKNYSA